MNKHSLLLFSLMAGVTLSAKQEVSVQNISLKSVSFHQATCLAVQCDLTLSQTYNERIISGDSSELYYFEVWLKEGDEYLHTTEGFNVLTDSLGRLNCRQPIYLQYDVKAYGAFTVYIPFAAIGIESGIHQIKPVIKIVDNQGNIIKPGFGGNYFKLDVPPKLQVTISVQDIQVAETNTNGKTWDYPLVNPEDEKPEVCWLINYGGYTLCRSPYEINSFLYQDKPFSFHFTISRNDLFTLDVDDYDLPNYSDKIGAYPIDMNKMQALIGTDMRVKFNQVERLNFTINSP